MKRHRPGQGPFRVPAGQPRVVLKQVLLALRLFERYRNEALLALAALRTLTPRDDAWVHRKSARFNAEWSRAAWRDLCEMIGTDPRKLDLFDQILIGRATP